MIARDNLPDMTPEEETRGIACAYGPPVPQEMLRSLLPSSRIPCGSVRAAARGIQANSARTAESRSLYKGELCDENF